MKQTPNPSRWGNAPALRFHHRALSFLSGLSFELIDDPSLIRNPYGVTWARYKSAQQFFLHVGFDLIDGNYAQISCGREWRKGPDWARLSNNLSSLAARFGFDLPRTYPLGYGPDIDRTIDRMLVELERVLPPVLREVTLEDLLAIESEEFGAQQIATRRYGSGYLDYVQPSEFGLAASRRV